MKAFYAIIGVLTFQACFQPLRAQSSISITVIYPKTNAIVHQNPFVAVYVTGPYEMQTVQANVENRTATLLYNAHAYTNCDGFGCNTYPAWTNTLSLAGLQRGVKMFTVTATDVFGNSGQAQFNILYDLPPALFVTAPAAETVARPGVHVSISATDDDPSGTTLAVYQAQDFSGGPLLAIGTNTLDTNLDLSAYDGGIAPLMLRAIDSANQWTTTFRTVHVQSSSNLVEIDNVSGGLIMDAQSDRLVFQDVDDSPAPGYYQGTNHYRLKLKSRTDATESLAVDQLITAQGAWLVPYSRVLYTVSPSLAHSCASANELYLWATNFQTELGFNCNNPGIGVVRNENYVAWGWDTGGSSVAQISRTEFLTTNTVLITNGFPGYFDISWDVAANGDVAFAPVHQIYGSPPNGAVYRYRDGAITMLANDPSNFAAAVKTDGTNVFYVTTNSTTQALMLVNDGGQSKVAEGLQIGTDFLLNGGWVAYERQAPASGVIQIWRRAPAGVLTELTFYGSSSRLAALAPNGEVAFYTLNDGRLHISKGTWPPVDIAVNSLFIGEKFSFYWLDNRWCVALGRSLFQIYTGTPQIVSPRTSPDNKFRFDLVAANGQRIITEASTDLAHWTDFATNVIADGAIPQVEDTGLSGRRRITFVYASNRAGSRASAGVSPQLQKLVFSGDVDHTKIRRRTDRQFVAQAH